MIFLEVPESIKKMEINNLLYNPVHGLYSLLKAQTRNLPEELRTYYRMALNTLADALREKKIPVGEVAGDLVYTRFGPPNVLKVIAYWATKAWKRMFPGREIPEYIKRIREHQEV